MDERRFRKDRIVCRGSWPLSAPGVLPTVIAKLIRLRSSSRCARPVCLRSGFDLSLYAIDGDQRIIWWSPQMSRMLGSFLDNATMILATDSENATRYIPLLLLDEAGVRRYQ
jgi:hypothetical protein